MTTPFSFNHGFTNLHFLQNCFQDREKKKEYENKLGGQNWIRPMNPIRHNTKLAGYGLRLNGFVSYSG